MVLSGGAITAAASMQRRPLQRLTIPGLFVAVAVIGGVLLGGHEQAGDR